MTARDDVRPAPSSDAAAGFHWEPVTAGPEWRMATDDETMGKCRHSTRHQCVMPPELALNRGWGSYSRTPRTRRDSWWLYCSEHAYGKWLENGLVMQWRLVKDDEA